MVRQGLKGILLDTNILILAMVGDGLTPWELAQMNGSQPVHASVASLWEIAIKSAKGKLEIKMEWVFEFLRVSEVPLVAIEQDHLLRLERLEWGHRDPFDRLLLAQAMSEDLCVLTRDREMVLYGQHVLQPT